MRSEDPDRTAAADKGNVITLDPADRRRDEILTRRHRLRRSSKPEWDEDPSDRPRRYPHTLDCGLDQHIVRYRRSRWRSLGEWEEELAPVRLRETFAWVEREGKRVAAVGLTEIDGHTVGPWEFWAQLDSQSQYLNDWAETLLSAWANFPFDVLSYGPALDVELVWIEPRYPYRGIWKPVAQAFIERMMPSCSLLLASCFPLEYAGLAPRGKPSRIGFERRRAALMRVCEREFGMRPLPGPWRARLHVEAALGRGRVHPGAGVQRGMG
jgi:hypothetical protein